MEFPEAGINERILVIHSYTRIIHKIETWLIFKQNEKKKSRCVIEEKLCI